MTSAPSSSEIRLPFPRLKGDIPRLLGAFQPKNSTFSSVEEAR